MEYVFLTKDMKWKGLAEQQREARKIWNRNTVCGPLWTQTIKFLLETKKVAPSLANVPSAFACGA
jgi:hypothetical protein